MAASITFRDLIKEARSVPIFIGDGTYSLKNFIDETETILSIVNEEAGKAYLYRILLTKIQGPAGSAIRRIQDQSWDNVKAVLKTSFGVSEHYLHLKEEADKVQSKNVSHIYSNLYKLLDKLNLKYQLDDNKPVEFSPSNNEKSILEKFLNKINRTDSMYLRTKDVKSLEEAYIALKQTGVNLSDEKFLNRNPNQPIKSEQSYNRNNNNKNYFSHSRNPINHNIRYPNQSNNVNSHNSRFRNSSNFRNGNYSGNFYNRNNNVERPFPMDVDNSETAQNFHRGPPTHHYP